MYGEVEEQERFTDEDKKKFWMYQNTFGTPEGRQVLTDILGILKFHGKILSPEDAALHNAGIQILENCGIWYAGNEFSITDKLIELSILNEE